MCFFFKKKKPGLTFWQLKKVKAYSRYNDHDKLGPFFLSWVDKRLSRVESSRSELWDVPSVVAERRVWERNGRIVPPEIYYLVVLSAPQKKVCLVLWHRSLQIDYPKVISSPCCVGDTSSMHYALCSWIAHNQQEKQHQRQGLLRTLYIFHFSCGAISNRDPKKLAFVGCINRTFCATFAWSTPWFANDGTEITTKASNIKTKPCISCFTLLTISLSLCVVCLWVFNVCFSPTFPPPHFFLALVGWLCLHQLVER